MTTEIEPPRAPRHRCINAACGCTDLVSAGPCSEWCSANGIELTDAMKGQPLPSCGCGHQLCAENMPARQGVVPASERGYA